MATTFGPYELRDLLGRGGMGEVHRAFDREQAREVALKLLPPALAEDAGFVERFRRESYAAAQLNDPHVIPIHRYGAIDGRLYIDMRLVEGCDLARLLARDGPLPPARAVAMIGQAAQALDAAHRAQLVHRDVKPSNLLVTPTDFVYLVDFGIAHVMGRLTQGPALTTTGATIGTLDYMAPERFLDRPVDPRADVYSLGCVLYEALTGRRPFPLDSAPALMHAHLSVPPPRATALCPGLPDGLDEVIARSMAKDPAHRYPSAGALAEDARAALDGVSVGVPTMDAAHRPQWTPPPPAPRQSLPPPPQPARRNPSRRVGLIAAGGALAAAALVTAALVGVLMGQAGANSTGAATPTQAAPSRAAPESAPAGIAAAEQDVSVGAGEPDVTGGGGGNTAPSATPPAAPPAAASVPPASTESAAVPQQPVGDLGLSVPVTVPACDGRFAVFVGAAVTPGIHADEVSALLAAHPGASYLYSDAGCGSLRSRFPNGDIFYAVYLGPFDSIAQACAVRDGIGGDSYVNPLDNVTSVDQQVQC